MRKIIPIILFTILTMVGCSTLDCPLNNTVYTKYKLDGDVKQLTGCTMTISTPTKSGVDSILINMQENADSFSIPTYPLVLRCLKESGLTAFFTRSSAANIPVNMALCEKLGMDKDMYSVSIPLGATINMDGAAITITIMTLAAANTLGTSTLRLSQ